MEFEPFESLYNRPGQAQLHFRVGTFETFFNGMLDRVRAQRSLDGPLEPALARLTLEDPENWVVGLFDAWARTGDVLTFYQERLINEGYLGTALRDLSVRELVRQIGYRPSPPIAASGLLAFNVGKGREEPEEVLLPSGVRVAGPPRSGHPSQTFQSSETLEARAEWNKIELEIPESPVEATIGPTEVKLQGVLGSVNPGTVLLIVGTWNVHKKSVERRILRTVESVERHPGPVGQAWTRVTWSQAIPTSGTLSAGPRVFVMLEQAFLFGHSAPHWNRLSTATQRLYQPIQGGVSTSTDGLSWQALNGDKTLPPGTLPDPDLADDKLPTAAVNHLLAGPQGHLFAGTDLGVYRSKGKDAWTAATTGMRARRVLCMAWDGQRGQLFAGTDTGLIFRSVDNGVTWEPTSGQAPVTYDNARAQRRQKSRVAHRPPRAPIRSLKVMETANKKRRLLAATDAGIFLGTEQGSTWTSTNQGLPWREPSTGLTSLAVFALAVSGSTAYAGTEKGFFYRDNFQAAGKWAPFNKGIMPSGASSVLLPRVQSMHRAVIGHSSILFAATDQGLFRRNISIESEWRKISIPDAPEAVSTVVTWHHSKKAVLLVGTKKGLFLSEDQGLTWSHPKIDGQHAPVNYLAAQGNRVLAITPFGGFADEQWPHFRVSKNPISLNKVVKHIAPKSWIALVDSKSNPTASVIGIHRVSKTDQVQHSGFTLSKMITQVTVEDDTGLSQFDPRQTLLLADSRELPLFTTQEPDLRTVQKGQTQLLLPSEVPAFPTQRLLVLTGLPASGSGKTGGLRSSPVATRFGQSISAVSSKLTPKGLEIVVDPALEESLDAASVVIYGNVAEAVQGETVSQVLGSGDAEKSSQSFVLTRPLSWISAPTADTGRRSTLRIEVDGLLWQEAPSFIDQGPRDRVYTVSWDLNGRDLVTFGDGEKGARLPTGFNNIKATFLSGVWSQSLEAGELTLLRTRPSGLRGVLNPLPIEGGIRAENLVQTKLRAPLVTRTLDRVVSLEDLRDFVASFPGIEKSLLTLLDIGSGMVPFLTLATRDGSPIKSASQLFQRLKTQLKALSVPSIQPKLGSYQGVSIEVSVLITAEDGVQPREIEESVRQSLLQDFGYSGSRFLATFAAYEISSAINALPGVRSVQLQSFQPAQGMPEVSVEGVAPNFESLTARPARVEETSQAKTILPAQLLFLEPSSLTVDVKDG